MVYKLLVLYLFLVTIIYQFVKSTQKTNWKNKNIFLIPAFFGLFFVMGFRSISVGSDTYNYSLIFNSISKLPISSVLSEFYTYDVEIGFAILAKISSIITDNYYFFQVLISFLFCFLIYRFIRDNATDYITSTILFMSLGIYLFSFNGIRQMLAVAFIANAWSELRQSNYKTVIILSLIAVSMHLSSVIAICIFVIYAIRNNRKLIIASFLVVLIFPYLFNDVLPFVAKYLTADDNYVDNKREIQEANLAKILWGIEGIFALYIILYKKKFQAEDQFVALMSLINVSFNIISLYFNYFERVGLYFSPFLILLFGIIGNSIKDRFLNKCYYFALNLCFLLFFFRATSTGQYIYSFFL